MAVKRPLIIIVFFFDLSTPLFCSGLSVLGFNVNFIFPTVK